MFKKENEKRKWSRIVSGVLAIVFVVSLMMTSVAFAATSDLSYPAQLVKLSIYGGKRNLNITGYGENSALNTWPTAGNNNENWRIDYVQDGVFKIVNEMTDRLVSVANNSAVNGASCVLMSDNGSNSQKWRITSVEQDFLGNDLYYKIANYANQSLVLTYNVSSNTVTLKNYTGANNQKWKINADGLDGFAANCVVAEGEKAGTIGGLLGETVFVSNLSQLKSALANTKPLTIVITQNIDNCNDEMYDLRIASNKTIVGSYRANRLTDARLRTDDYFQNEGVSNNIIVRNVNFRVASRANVVAFAVYGSRNVWVDHCDFNASLGFYYDEVGKFVWVNRSEYASKDPDFVTLSYNKFTRRFWGVAFGAMYRNEDRASVMYNKFEDIAHRAPQLGNGKLHVYNNTYTKTQNPTDGNNFNAIKCGDGSDVYSESNRFVNYSTTASGYPDYEVVVYDGGAFKDTGSYTNRTHSTPYLLAHPSGAAVTSWNPATNYGYKTVKAYGSNDILAFCNNYTGTVSSFSALKHINQQDLSSYVVNTINSPFLFDLDEEPGGDDGIVDGGIYMIKNMNSNIYLDVAGGVAANGTNVQQWGASGPTYYNTWKVVSAGNGYYYIYSQVGNGNTYLLDVENNSAASGTNIGIWQATGADAQLFKLQLNSDGSYAVLTKTTNGASGLDVEYGYTHSGANVQQWGYTDGAHQKWYFERIS